MNPLGINLWNWCAGLSEECLGLPEKVARMGFTAVELPMTQPQVPSALADEIRNTGLAVSLCAALGPGRDLSSFDSAVRASTMDYLTTPDGPGLHRGNAGRRSVRALCLPAARRDAGAVRRALRRPRLPGRRHHRKGGNRVISALSAPSERKEEKSEKSFQKGVDNPDDIWYDIHRRQRRERTPGPAACEP